MCLGPTLSYSRDPLRDSGKSDVCPPASSALIHTRQSLSDFNIKCHIFLPRSPTLTDRAYPGDNHGAHASVFANAITPYTNYASGVQNLGREAVAQWLRVSFHDFVTAHVEEGTGGIDAMSMADFISLSVSSVGHCGGPQIPVRGGRVDAAKAGTPGVPAPESSLEETWNSSAEQASTSSISLTASGRIMGSVHHGGFPTDVGLSRLRNPRSRIR
ncbi:hypothetical protein LZ554_005793 [Drepanopeziza brunnea f. sp. 'monogermtubi']|nr:hypothetical protein LZ554_005793 [Drepanopeziza brunnea f. sp. 'monogermtubi']